MQKLSRSFIISNKIKISMPNSSRALSHQRSPFVEDFNSFPVQNPKTLESMFEVFDVDSNSKVESVI